MKQLAWRWCRYLLASHYIFYWSLRRRMFDWHNPQYTIDPGTFKDICKDVLIPKGVLIPVEVSPGPASCPRILPPLGPFPLRQALRRERASNQLVQLVFEWDATTERPSSCLPTERPGRCLLTEFDELGGAPLNGGQAASLTEYKGNKHKLLFSWSHTAPTSVR